jgi:hypothetical protein
LNDFAMQSEIERTPFEQLVSQFGKWASYIYLERELQFKLKWSRLRCNRVEKNNRKGLELTSYSSSISAILARSTLIIFSKFSPSTAGSHFQRTCAEKLKLLHFAQNCLLSVRCPLTIRARTSGSNFAKFDQRGECAEISHFDIDLKNNTTVLWTDNLFSDTELAGEVGISWR